MKFDTLLIVGLIIMGEGLILRLFSLPVLSVAVMCIGLFLIILLPGLYVLTMVCRFVPARKLILIILFSILGMITVFGKELKTGYQVVIDNKPKINVVKTRNPELVNKIVNANLKTTDFNIEQAMDNQNFFIVDVNGKNINVERKKIVRGNKYRKITKRDLR